MNRRDGSQTLCVQHEAPESEKRANWIHIPPLKIVGPIVIQPFGVLAGIAIVLGYLLAMRRVRATGLDTGVLRSGIWWILVPGIVAAHWVSKIIYFRPRR